MKLKRIFAYFLDVIIVSVVSSMIFALPFFKEDFKNYDRMTTVYLEEIQNIGSEIANEDKLVDMEYDIYKSSATLLIIKTGILILYFGGFGYWMKGQTFGKRILGLKIVSNDDDKTIGPGMFILREVLVTNFIPETLSLIFLIMCSKGFWIASSLYTSYASYIISFILVGFMIFRDDERGLHDIICNTKVISTKAKKEE